MSELTDLYTTEAVENMMKAWYGEKFGVNDNVILIVYEMIENSSECSSSIDKVPYKLGGVTGVVGKLGSVAITTIKRIIVNAGNDKHYIMCLKSIALYNKSKIRLASMGQ